MNGGHDLGGVHGLGAIHPETEASEPIFHAEWERRAFAITLACGFLGQWNLDESRHARERQHPADYLKNSYYENWMTGLESLLVEKGIISEAELLESKPLSDTPATLLERRPDTNRVREILASGGPVDLAAGHSARFKVGDAVLVHNNHPRHHTRAPRYVRGRVGVIDAYRGSHIFPDANALGDERGEHLYAVRFDAAELWGEAANTKSAVYVDLWEPYLTCP